MNNPDFVRDLQQKGYDVWDGRSPTDPELEEMGLRNIHHDADGTSMSHVRFGNFMDKDRYYFRVDNTETRHRFYVSASLGDADAMMLMLEIKLELVHR